MSVLSTFTGSPKVKLHVVRIHVSSCGNHRAYLSGGVGRKLTFSLIGAPKGGTGRRRASQGDVDIHGVLWASTGRCYGPLHDSCLLCSWNLEKPIRHPRGERLMENSKLKVVGCPLSRGVPCVRRICPNFEVLIFSIFLRVNGWSTMCSPTP